jgi:FtsP/CotA-like multicopper oxidase with cupredoxin domain
MSFLNAGKKMSFTIIGRGQGLAEKPAVVDEIFISPSERVEVIFNFTNVVGDVTVTNSANRFYPIGPPPNADEAQVMVFRDTTIAGSPGKALPAIL